MERVKAYYESYTYTGLCIHGVTIPHSTKDLTEKNLSIQYYITHRDEEINHSRVSFFFFVFVHLLRIHTKTGRTGVCVYELIRAQVCFNFHMDQINRERSDHRKRYIENTEIV